MRIQTVLNYDTSGRLVSMGTPYGTTSWDPATPAMFDRMLRVTRPDGTQTALAYVKAATLGADGLPLVPATFLAAQLPQATPDPNTTFAPASCRDNSVIAKAVSTMPSFRSPRCPMRKTFPASRDNPDPSEQQYLS